MNNKIKLSLIALAILSSNAMAEETLEDIIVTAATNSNQSIKNITSNIEVITADEIEERKFTTVAEAINSVAGVSFTDNGGIGKVTSIRVRGMDSQRVLILIDGMRYQDPSNMAGASIQHLMISEIERIEVIKGAQSGIWGADAATGVINIVTKSASEQTQININAEVGSFKTKKYGIGISSRGEIFELKVNAHKVDTDGFTTKTDEGADINDFEDDGYKNTTISAKLGINLTKDAQVTLEHISIDGVSDYDGFSPDDTSMKSDFETKMTKIEYAHKIGANHINIKHEVSKFKRDEIGTAWGVKLFDGKITNSEIKNSVAYGFDNYITFGANRQETEVAYTGADSSSNGDKYTNKSIFVTNTNKLGDTTILTQSIRYDNYDNFKDKITGKVGVKHTTQNGITVSANYGTAYNAPNIIQILNPWGTPNLNLQPEEIESFDLSLAYSGARLTYFNQKIDNMISWVGTGFTNVEGTSKINGIELSYKTNITDNILLNTSYTHLLKAVDKNGNDLKKRVKDHLKVGIGYYGIDDLYLGLNAEYIGSRIETKYNPDYSTSDVQTGKYTIFNFTANYAVTDNIQVYGKIDNLTDKKYQTSYGYATSPRAFYVGVKAKF